MNPFSIYFPQFYPSPTNDRAWGSGFTDWTLVANANLRDRWARRAPRRGFYDGSQPAVHQAQLAEMKSFGLGGIAVYHYWFYSHQELPAFERSMLGMSAAQSIPWFLIWASEGWSRRWLGDPTSLVSLSSAPSAAEIAQHCDHLQRCFDNPAYFRWNDKPLFVWYHLDHFTEPERVVEGYKECLARSGVSIATGHFIKNPFDIQHSGLVDVSYLFEPRLFFGMTRVGRTSGAKRAFDRLETVIGKHAAARLLVLLDRFQQKGHTYPAEHFLRYLASPERARLVATIPGLAQEVVSPGWNNTPRYDDRFTAIADLAPEQFGRLVRQAASATGAPPPLINAWNEWSEGAAIEPCAYHGTRYLDALGALAPVADTERAV